MNKDDKLIVFIAIFVILITLVMFGLKIERKDNEIKILKEKITKLEKKQNQ